ncbi:MAG: DMT family transporter [Bacillota bacterium]
MFLPYFLLTGVAFIWGLNSVLGKALVSYLPPFAITAGRFSIAGVILILWLLWKRKSLPPPESRLPLFLLGLAGVFAFNSMIYTGLQYTSAINCALINGFTPIVTMFLAALALKEKVTWPQAGGALLSLLGVAMIIGGGSLRVFLSLSFNYGDLIIILSTLVWAFYTVYGKKVMATVSPMDTIAYSTLAALPFLWTVGFWELRDFSLPPLSWFLVLAILFLGVFASVVAYLWWNTGVQRLGAARGVNFLNLIPVFSVISSAIFLGERLHPHQAAGGALILLGVLLSSAMARQKARPRVSPLPSERAG